MMTKAEFIARSGIPRQTLERWLRAGKIVPADFDDNGKPLFSDEQISAAKALHKPEHNPKKSVTAADRAQSLFEEDTPMDTIIADNINPADSDATPDADSDVSTDNTHADAQHVAQIDSPVDSTLITPTADDVPTFEIDAEFRDLCPPLTDDEFNLLEANILRDGIQDPIKIWRGVIVDGHNRYSIAQKHGLTFATVEMHFDTRDDAMIWIITNQSGRRNLSAYDRARLALKLKPVFSSKAKFRQGSRTDFYQKSDKSCPPSNTLGELAKIAGVSHDTIHKVEIIEAEATPEIIADVRAGNVSINAAYEGVKAGATTADEAKQKARDRRQARKAKAPAPLEKPPFPTMDDVKLPTAPMEPTRRNQIADAAIIGDDDDRDFKNPDFNTSENTISEFISDAAITPATDDDLDDVLDGTQPADTPKYGRDNILDMNHIAETIALKRAADFLRQAAVDTPTLNEFFNDLAAMCDRRQKN